MNTKAKILTAVLAVSTLLTTACSTKKYNYNLDDYVTLGTYKGIEVSKKELDEEIQTNIDSLLDSKSTTTEITDRESKKGDVVNIDYTASLDGKEYEVDGGTLKDTAVDVEIGSGDMIESFENALIGKKTGDKYTADVTFPEDYKLSDELKGKTLQFEIKINKISEKDVPEFNDAFVAENTSYKTVDEYKTEAKKELFKNYSWNTAVTNANVAKYPEKEVKEYYNNTVNTYKAYATQYGASLDAFIQGYMGTTIDAFLANAADYAKLQVKNEMCVHLIAQKENIEVTSDEYKARIADYVEKYGAADQKELETNYTRATIEEAMLYDMVVEFVVANAVEAE